MSESPQNCEQVQKQQGSILESAIKKMKYIIKFFLFTLALYSCNSIQQKSVEKPDLEMDVINDLLPQLIPKRPPCMVVPLEGEDADEYDKRLQAFYEEVDSVGKKIEIVSLLTKLDSNFIEAYERLEKKLKIEHLLNAPIDDRRIDSSMINKINGFQILLVKEARNKPGGLTDCYTFGQFNISRVGFNRDSTRASFTYFIDDGSCTGGNGGIVDAVLKKGKWQRLY